MGTALRLPELQEGLETIPGMLRMGLLALSCVGPGFGLDDPGGSLPAQDSMILYIKLLDTPLGGENDSQQQKTQDDSFSPSPTGSLTTVFTQMFG
ncbi:hypothetical protein TURU_132245 [Turdus rufiventris]|nr:hypothetical protein TURU_132245 [Turdus rufiventris]